MEQPQNLKKPTPGVHDPDLDLGYILHHADAPNLGAHPFVDALLRPKPRLMGQVANLQPVHGAQISGGASSAIDSNPSGTSSTEAVSGETSKESPVSDTGVGVQRSNSAGVESDSAIENKQ